MHLLLSSSASPAAAAPISSDTSWTSYTLTYAAAVFLMRSSLGHMLAAHMCPLLCACPCARGAHTRSSIATPWEGWPQPAHVYTANTVSDGKERADCSMKQADAWTCAYTEVCMQLHTHSPVLDAATTCSSMRQTVAMMAGSFIALRDPGTTCIHAGRKQHTMQP
jgi:hypothetical protein